MKITIPINGVQLMQLQFIRQLYDKFLIQTSIRPFFRLFEFIEVCIFDATAWRKIFKLKQTHVIVSRLYSSDIGHQLISLHQHTPQFRHTASRLQPKLRGSKKDKSLTILYFMCAFFNLCMQSFFNHGYNLSSILKKKFLH